MTNVRCLCVLCVSVVYLYFDFILLFSSPVPTFINNLWYLVFGMVCLVSFSFKTVRKLFRIDIYENIYLACSQKLFERLTEQGESGGLSSKCNSIVNFLFV